MDLAGPCVSNAFDLGLALVRVERRASGVEARMPWTVDREPWTADQIQTKCRKLMIFLRSLEYFKSFLVPLRMAIDRMERLSSTYKRRWISNTNILHREL